MITFERIKYLSEKQGKSLNKVEEELGYGKNVLYRLKNTNPSAERLQEIADYFDVSVDYLLGRIDDPNPIASALRDFEGIEFEDEETPEYFAIQRKSKKLNQKEQQRLLKLMEAVFEDLDNGEFEEDEDDDL